MSHGSATRGRHRVESGLGRRFRGLFWGQALSQVGDYVAYLTIPLFMLQLSDANVDLALTYVLEILPGVIFGFLGGVLLDRLPLRSIMITADLARAGAFTILGVIALGPEPNLKVVVFLMAFLVGTFASVFQNGLQSLIPALVRDDQLSTANSRIATSQQVALVLGPLLAGAMADTVGVAPGLFLNGGTFLLSAVSVWMIGPVPVRIPREERSKYLEEAMFSEPHLRASTIAAASANAAVGFLESTFVVLGTEVVGAGEAQIGIMFMSLGLGGIIGALMAPRVSRLIGHGRTMTLGMITFGAAFLVTVRTRFGFSVLALLFIMFVGISLVNVPLATIRQVYTPTAMMGRVITAARTIGWSTLPLGALVGAAIADGTDYRLVAQATPLVLIVTGVWLVFTPIWSDRLGAARGKRLAE
jgi:predicted MFS family arabinose efflux permease